MKLWINTEIGNFKNKSFEMKQVRIVKVLKVQLQIETFQNMKKLVKL